LVINSVIPRLYRFKSPLHTISTLAAMPPSPHGIF
jgi:hypothetical protein